MRIRVVPAALAAVCGLACGPALRAATVLTPLNASFELGSLVGWTSAGDVSTQTLGVCVQPQMPSEGLVAACLSTESLFGGMAVGGVRSELESPPVTPSFRPKSLTVTFDFDYGTDETPRSIGFDDLISVTLLTGAGPYPILIGDTWGTTPNGSGLAVTGSPGLTFPTPGCDQQVFLQTGRINVKWKRFLSVPEQNAIQNAPIVVQFTVADRGDASRLTFLCLDNLGIKASH